jgi:hypothetical protein
VIATMLLENAGHVRSIASLGISSAKRSFNDVPAVLVVSNVVLRERHMEGPWGFWAHATVLTQVATIADNKHSTQLLPRDDEKTVRLLLTKQHQDTHEPGVRLWNSATRLLVFPLAM